MLPEFMLLIPVLSVVSCQIDGEFWWLKNDVTKLKHGVAPSPKFDDVNELDTDETAKIIFRDDKGKRAKSLDDDNDKITAIHFRDETELAKPFFNQINVNNKVLERPLKQTDIKNNHSLQKLEDEFKFVFPSNDNINWGNRDNDIENKKTFTTDNKVEPSNTISYNTTMNTTPKTSDAKVTSSDEKNMLLPENICTFIKKYECIRNEGTLYETRIKPNMIMNIPNTQVVCCILPITTTSLAKIIFPDNYWDIKRHKRSNVNSESPELKQRNTLMKRKYSSDNLKARVTTPSTRKKVNQKITNSDEYSADPYWNIKNSNFRNPDTVTYQDPDTAPDYAGESYVDDYTAELPKPGLIGIYSDHKQTQSTWTQNKNKGFYYDSSDSVEEEEFESPFGYSTIDPRKDHRLTSKPSKPFRVRPLKLTTASPRYPETNLQNPTITFTSNPDFQVLQGFKLLNLMRNKNRVVRKTSENNNEYANNGLSTQEKPPNSMNYLHNNYKHDLYEVNLKQKQFNECGINQRHSDDCESGLKQGVVQPGGHPWIALVVLTKSEHSILCYATLVHSRVAVSIADCINGYISAHQFSWGNIHANGFTLENHFKVELFMGGGNHCGCDCGYCMLFCYLYNIKKQIASRKSPGEVSIIAGVQNLDEYLTQSQRRMATATIDSEYAPGKVLHNLALLHWLRPLIFDARIQPVCLGDPHPGSTCVFVGWAGYDQEMHSDLRWQQASILTPQNCSERLSELEVSDALCAAVESRGTVTGVGGPLLCKRNERWWAVGVAVWRDDAVILLPLREWVMRNMISLRVQ